MKIVLAVMLAAILAITSHAQLKLPEQYKRMVSSRRVCVKREIVDGNVVTHWQRDGRPDWVKPAVETNALKRINGVRQNNALQNEVEKLRTKIQDEIEDLNEELEQYEEYKKEYPLLIGIWNAKITGIKTRIAILKAVSGTQGQ